MVAKNIIFARQYRNQGSLSAGPQALILGILAWLGISLPSVALEVTARLDNSDIRLGESVRLILVADAQFEKGPDLSPLQRDFQITGRSSARQITEINGQRREHHELRLVLAPRRAGHLEIPAIAFGEVQTQPLTLAVTETAADPAATARIAANAETMIQPPGLPVPPKPGPFLPPPVGAVPAMNSGPWGSPRPFQSQGPVPDWNDPGAPVPGSATSHPPPDWLLPGQAQSIADGQISPAVTPTPHAKNVPIRNPSADTDVGLSTVPTLVQKDEEDQEEANDPSPSRWSWIQNPSRVWSGDENGFLAGLITLVILVWGWRLARRRPLGGVRNSQSAPAQILPKDLVNLHPVIPIEDPLSAAITAVRLAYEGSEASAARQALLAWSNLVLTDRPPSNLAQLAKRCGEPLRGEILLLEQAFFSPQPLDWNHQPVWKHLKDFVPLPPTNPAFFRQKKAIRRTSAPA
ncbi:MAG: hypothetical protein EOM92_10620 [Gammaproteobacteria bacterium]|nr:hypothetical protein [Gammaproteobacteria bacterium]